MPFGWPSVEHPITQWFKSKIQLQEYASGGTSQASKGWLVILIAALLLNTTMLLYFIAQPGLVTDYSQPPQLFAQAVNSPPARELAGSCGSGPEGKQYKLGWLISHEGGHLYIEPGPSECSALLTDEHKSGHVKSDTRVVDRAVGPSGEVNLTVGTELLHQSSTARSIGSLSPDDELGQAKGRTWDSFAKLSKKRILL
jgi:hypothetical protein